MSSLSKKCPCVVQSFEISVCRVTKLVSTMPADAITDIAEQPQNKPSRLKNEGSAVQPQPLRNCLAKALYDNLAEAPDELAFRKGDILTVLEQNTNGLEGWWLCSLRGRQGIVPGNRLRLLPGMYDPTGLGNAGTTPSNSNSSHALRRSWTSNPNKIIDRQEQMGHPMEARGNKDTDFDPNYVVTPQKIGAVYLYDIPPGTKMVEKPEATRSTSLPSRHPYQGYNPTLDVHGGSYDTPPSPRAVRQDAYDEPRSHIVCSSPQPALATYDEPRSNAPVPSSDVSSTSDYDIPSADQLSAYDIPRSAEKGINNVSHIITIADNYDIPQPAHKSSPPIYDGRAFSRSSGDTSASSSFRSPSGSHSSIETLSLSSVSGSNRSSLEQHPSELYDIPPEPQPISETRMAQTARSVYTAVPYQSSFPQELYDVPPNNAPAQFYDTPVPRPVRAQMFEDAYDIPPPTTRDNSFVPKADVVDSSSRGSFCNTEMSDTRPGMLPEYKELPLELDAAIETLVRYQHEVQGAISKLFSFVSTTWRKHDNMEAKVYDIEISCHRIHNSLIDFLNFAQGALANSAHAADKTLSTKLSKLVKPLRESCIIVKKCVQSLDEKGWHTEKLARNEESITPDELDQLVACARGLVEDVRQVASFIQGNSTLLFQCQSSMSDSKAGVKPPVAPKPDIKVKPLTSSKPTQRVQERPLPPTPSGLIKSQLSCKEYFNEYDYVNLESKETVERENEAIKAALPKEMCQSFDELVKQSEVPVVNHNQDLQVSAATNHSPLAQKDIQLLQFYVMQIETHIMHLTNAIDAFLVTIKNNQPPKVFVGHSKFIVISAHKLVYIGDTVHRNVGNQELKTRIMQKSNSLCDSLKTLVTSTKKAATEFPSVVAVQEMVDCVVDVSHLANDLKVAILQPVKV